jgi:hypothetical protein
MPCMSDALTLHLMITCCLIGLVWTVQVAVYPLFDRVGGDAFAQWHACYTARIGAVVGPLMLAEVGSGAWLLWAGGLGAGFWTSLGLLALVWLSTAVVQVPLHNRLSLGFEATTHRRLVCTNWLRTAAWTLRGICLLFCL